MKKIFSTLAAVLTLTAAAAADAALLASAPADCSAVISIDVRELLKNPEVRNIAAQPGIIKLLAEVEQAGLRLTDVREIAVFNWDDCWYGAFRMEDPEVLRKALAAYRAQDGKLKIVTESAAGRRTWRLKDPKRQRPKHIKKELCLTFLDDGAVVVAKAVELEKFLKARRISPETVTRLAGRRAEVWCEYRRQGGKTKSGDIENFDARLMKGSLDAKLEGPAGKDIGIYGTADFSNPESARSMGMTLPGILSFFAGLVFAEDPDGGDMFVKALRTEARGNTLHFSIQAPEELCGRLLRALEKFLSEKNDDGEIPAAILPGSLVSK